MSTVRQNMVSRVREGRGVVASAGEGEGAEGAGVGAGEREGGREE